MIPAWQLMGLRTGARLRVTLRSGRTIEVELLGKPTLSPVGKPGIHRVQLYVLDVEAAARTAQHGPRHTAFGHSPTAMLAAKHTVNGAQVVAVLP